MPHTIQLRKTRDGSTFQTLDIDDYEADNSTGIYKVLNISISNPAPEVLSHVPDVGDSHIVNYKDGDRLAVILLNVFSSGDDNFDDPLDAIADLRRWGREAFNRELDGSTWPIELYVKRQSTSNATIHYVKGGWIDDSASHFRGDIVNKKEARDVVLNLWLSPYGIAENDITLVNEMFSSPHFVEMTAGLGHGWDKLDGAETTATAGSIWLIGGQSQKVTAGADNHGIQCDVVENGSATAAVCYVWIYVQSGDVDVHLWDSDAVGSEGSTDATSGNADKTAIGASGNTWLRIVVSSNSIPAGNDCRIRVTAKGGAAVFFVDGAYLRYGVTAAPDAWMSARNIDNRGDIQTTSQATENYLNYWDVWGVPGDAPALVKTRFNWTTTAANANLMYVGKIADGDLLAADEIYWIDDNALAVDDSGTGEWSQVAGGDAVGRTVAQYRRFTDGGAGTSTGSLAEVLSSNDAQSFTHNPKRILALVRASATTTIVNMLIFSNSAAKPAVITAFPTLDNANQWTYLDFGIVSLRDLLPLDVDDVANQDVTVYFAFGFAGDTDGTADIDAILFLPTEEQILLSAPYSLDFNPNTINTYIDGRYKNAVNSDFPVAMPRQGTLWTVEPGSIMSRYIWAVQEWDQVNLDMEGNHDPTIAAAISLSIWPRTRHLLGTE